MSCFRSFEWATYIFEHYLAVSAVNLLLILQRKRKKNVKPKLQLQCMIKRWFQMFKSQFSIPKKPAISTQNAYFDLWIIDIVRSNYQSQCNTVKR